MLINNIGIVSLAFSTDFFLDRAFVHSILLRLYILYNSQIATGTILNYEPNGSLKDANFPLSPSLHSTTVENAVLSLFRLVKQKLKQQTSLQLVLILRQFCILWLIDCSVDISDTESMASLRGHEITSMVYNMLSMGFMMIGIFLYRLHQ